MGQAESETVNATELADLLSVSRKTIAEWAASGIVVRVAHGKYNLRESVRGFAKHMRERGPAGDATAVAAVASHRGELLKIQAERAKFQLEQEREEWVTIADVEAHWASALRTLRSGVMAIPARVAARVPGLSREMVYEMDQEIREALTELARNGYPEQVVEERRTTT
jgi:phage terminase Nu1 subunit (DNA packaging protein)